MLFNEALVSRCRSTGNENFTFKLSTNVILITLHAGVEKRRNVIEGCDNAIEECGLLEEAIEKIRNYHKKMKKIMIEDEQPNNQPKTGTKLL